MACGCNKNKIKDRKNLVQRGKKVAEKKSLPLITLPKGKLKSNKDK